MEWKMIDPAGLFDEYPMELEAGEVSLRKLSPDGEVHLYGEDANPAPQNLKAVTVPHGTECATSEGVTCFAGDSKCQFCHHYAGKVVLQKVNACSGGRRHAEDKSVLCVKPFSLLRHCDDCGGISVRSVNTW